VSLTLFLLVCTFSLFLFVQQRTFLVISLLCCFVLLCEKFIQRLPKYFLKVILILGSISYSLYLLHVPLQIFMLIVIQTIGLDSKSIADSGLFFMFYFLVLFGVSFLVHRFFEIPARRRLRNMLSGHPQV
jgi:peptidoglycan/LPS O-acetylase OafA/YrhL